MYETLCFTDKNSLRAIYYSKIANNGTLFSMLVNSARVSSMLCLPVGFIYSKMSLTQAKETKRVRERGGRGRHLF